MNHTIGIRNTSESYPCREVQTLLAAMEALGRSGIPVGCRGGGCGACKVRIETGQVRTEKMSRAVLSAAEEAEGLVLACRAYPRSDLQVRAVGPLARCVERSKARSVESGPARSFLDAARAASPATSPAPTTRNHPKET